jgi:hypothetical protein
MKDSILAPRAVLKHIKRLRELESKIVEIHDLIGSFGEPGLFSSEMLSIAALAIEFNPDLILELGRGLGTSTALFRLIGMPVASICRSRAWNDHTATALQQVLSIDWTANIDAIIGEITEQNYPALLADTRRVMIFWDAHGYDVAETVLTEILPNLVGREVLSICHDMRDSRYCPADREYQNQPMWRGQSELYNFVRCGNVHSSFEQLISILDFTSRNGIPFISPTHALATNEETKSLFPHLGWPIGLWHYFEIPSDKQLTFPNKRPKDEVSLDDTGALSRVRALAIGAYDDARHIVYGGATCVDGPMLRIHTPAGQWHHAVEFPLVRDTLDPTRKLSILVHVVVHHGIAGLGILSADGQLPEEAYVSAVDGGRSVELRTAPVAECGALVVRNGAADGTPSVLDMRIVSTSILSG